MLELTIYSVDHGSAAHLRTPDGQLVVFDAGASESGPSPVDHILAQAYSNGRVPRVDVLVISHAHADHIRELARFDGLLSPITFYRNRSVPLSLICGPDGLSSASTALKRYLALDASYTATVPMPSTRLISPGELPPYLGSVRLQTFALTSTDFFNGAANLNDLSVLSVIQFGNLTLILPGDLEPLGQLLLLAKPGVREVLATGEYRVLIAPHHGRRSGIAYGEQLYPEFVNTIRPSLVIMSDVHGSEHTCPELYRGRASGHFVWCESDGTKSCVRSVLTTKTNDRIVVRSDGVSMPLVVVP